MDGHRKKIDGVVVIFFFLQYTIATYLLTNQQI